MNLLNSNELGQVTGGTEPDGDPGDDINPNETREIVETQIGESRWRYDLFGHAGNFVRSEFSDFQLTTDPDDFEFLSDDMGFSAQ